MLEGEALQWRRTLFRKRKPASKERSEETLSVPQEEEERAKGDASNEWSEETLSVPQEEEERAKGDAND